MIRFLSPFILSLMAIIPTKGYAFEVNETFPAGYVCKSHNLLESVVETDLKDTETAGQIMKTYFQMGECFMVNGAPVTVKEVYLKYTDNKGVYTEFLGVKPAGKDDSPMFYILVTPKVTKS